MKKTILFGILPLFLMVTLFSCKEDESTLLTPEIAISNTVVEMNVGNTTTLSAKITQWVNGERVKSNEDMSVKWESSDNSVVTVSGGKLTAVGGGTATIRAYSSSLTDIEATCEVTVHDIYVCGEIGIQHNNQNYKNIVVWKNGAIQDSLLVTRSNAMANAMTIVGNDVYVAGVVNATAKVWKNTDELYTISSASGAMIFTAVAVCGADVYTAGYDSISATSLVGKIWKNGVEYLTVDGAKVLALVADGNDIYAAGYVEEAGIKVGKIWKNGTVNTSITGVEGVALNAIFVDESGVYAAGYAVSNGTQVAKAWRNGAELYTLTNGSADAFATSIYLNNGIVYVGGRDAQGSNYARLWVNGENFTLNNEWGSKTLETATRCTSVAVAANEVIAVGTTFNNMNNQNCAILWRDGEIKSLAGALEKDEDIENTKSQNRATCVIIK